MDTTAFLSKHVSLAKEGSLDLSHYYHFQVTHDRKVFESVDLDWPEKTFFPPSVVL